MATLRRENLCSVGSFEIPRPKCVGMQFVSIRGRYGYYQTVNQSVATKYGLIHQQQRNNNNGMRRPTLPNYWVEGGGDQHSENGLGGRRGNAAAAIPEELTGLEPSPDYEDCGVWRKWKDARMLSSDGSADRIAVPDGRAPPAPPLPLWLRQSLLQHQRKENGVDDRNRRQQQKSPYGVWMAATANGIGNGGTHNDFMGTFGREQQSPEGPKTSFSVRL